jgi:NNP family nitrate/nitrite transporter-like MFS transporter
MIRYVAGFIALFILSGIGNGSMYKMIPMIFGARSHSPHGIGHVRWPAHWSASATAPRQRLFGPLPYSASPPRY